MEEGARKDVGDVNACMGPNHDMTIPHNLNGILGGIRRTRISVTMKFVQPSEHAWSWRNAESLGAFI